MGAHRITDKGDAKKYFTVIPNVVYTLGLSPHELALYNILKRTAGDDGKCWKSTATLARETNMSTGSVSKAKDSLCCPKTELAGLPLVTVTEEKNEKGGKPKHLITITDVWPFNATSSISEVDQPEQVQRVNLQVQNMKLPSSPGEIKKIPSEEDHVKKTAPDFIATLKADPFYSHVDFDVEVERMRRWLARPANKNRRMTERFVLGWVEKIDRPVEIPSNRNNGVDRAAKEAELKHKMGWDRMSA